ncbi:MAG: tetratricopeptide repeat protein [Pseudomonadota bacterium]|nr:tetratricopeptide repeat protein [Pseudomonadota bacterium]
MPSATPSTPDSARQADACIAEGNALEDAGDLTGAIRQYRKALTLAPGYWSAWLNLGIAYQAQGNHGQALEMFEAAYDANPAHHLPAYNLARHLSQTSGHAVRCADLLEQALRAKPDFFQALVLLADVRAEHGQRQQAIELLQQALALAPEHPGVLQNLATYLQQSGQIDRAIEVLQSISKPSASVLASLGQALRDRGQVSQALTLLEKAAAADSRHLSAYLMTLLFSPDFSPEQIRQAHERVNAALPAVEKVPVPFMPDASGSDGRRLRIGFLSPDLRAHSVAYFIEPLLTHLDRQHIEVFLYSATHRPDSITARLSGLAEHWRDLRAVSAEQAAAQIKSDGITILIDLAGHSSDHRLDVLALKPTPILATWLGYLGTTGLRTVDFRIVDTLTDPPGMTEGEHTERLIRMEAPQWCYQPQEHTPAVAPAPKERNGYVTFGSFNQCGKLSAPCLALWASVLAAVPQSRLLLAAVPEGMARERIQRIMSEAGIAAERLLFYPRTDWQQYFHLYGQADIALDSWPYTGATTLCDALMMGVPVISLAGRRSVSRSGASLLASLGHPEWVAADEQSFVRIATELARQPATLAQRQALREQFLHSPLTNGSDFAWRFAGALRQMLAVHNASC